jgi:Mg2+-importing ATPase
MEPILMGDLIPGIQRFERGRFPRAGRRLQKSGQARRLFQGGRSGPDPEGLHRLSGPAQGNRRQGHRRLQQHGVVVKVLTGDNDLVTRKVCTEVGLETGQILLGSAVENMTDQQLGRRRWKPPTFSRGFRPRTSNASSKPAPQRPRRRLHGRRHQRRPRLRAADVGISVDTAVDIAKESADMILLEKSLMVLEEGVLEGRKVFVNILKYIRMGASSNFGNMFSVLGASALFPFLPMLPIQILTNNLLYDFSQVPIPTDNVGATRSPNRIRGTWGRSRASFFSSARSVRFSITPPYAVMWFIFKCNQAGIGCRRRICWRAFRPCRRRSKPHLRRRAVSTPAGLSNRS